MEEINKTTKRRTIFNKNLKKSELGMHLFLLIVSFVLTIMYGSFIFERIKAFLNVANTSDIFVNLQIWGFTILVCFIPVIISTIFLMYKIDERIKEDNKNRSAMYLHLK